MSGIRCDNRKTETGWKFSFMAEDLKRVKCTSVTEALIMATEEAEKMRHVLVLYEDADGVGLGGMICDDTLDAKTCNWLVDQMKQWLMSR